MANAWSENQLRVAKPRAAATPLPKDVRGIKIATAKLTTELQIIEGDIEIQAWYNSVVAPEQQARMAEIEEQLANSGTPKKEEAHKEFIEGLQRLQSENKAVDDFNRRIADASAKVRKNVSDGLVRVRG